MASNSTYLTGKLSRLINAGLATLALLIITSPAFAAGPQPDLTGGNYAATPVSAQADQPNATCPPDGQCFADVPPDNVFYAFVNRIYQQDLVTGYPCGGPNEPCDPAGRPYYRPVNNVTRQQMAK